MHGHEDAPAGHPAHRRVTREKNDSRAVWNERDNSKRWQLGLFRVLRYQVTALSVGSIDEALRICRLLYVRAAAGATSEELAKYRDELAGHGAPRGSRKPKTAEEGTGL